MWLVTIMTFFPFATKIHTRYIIPWHTWHCGWTSSFFQYKKIHIYQVFSQSNLTTYNTSYTHDITIFYKSFS